MYLLTLLLACGGAPVSEDEAPSVAVTEEAVPEEAPVEEGAPTVNAAHKALFAPLPEAMESPANPLTDEKIALGRMLYYDARLSVNDEISCNTCHLLDKFGVDAKPTSPGHDGTLGPRNSPTVYNAALHIAQFWDGRAATVEEQAKMPITNPIEMGMGGDADVVAKVKGIAGYAAPFAAAFPGEEDPVTIDNLAMAIGAFERKLVTPAPFDAYLKGDATALSPEQRAGLDLFVSTGCITCHMGVGVGGNLYQKLGLLKPFETSDVGRMEVTGNEADKHVFKSSSLRNVTETGPYLHNGSVASLEETVKLMADYQLGKELSDEEVASLVTFFGALKGTIPEDFIKEPELPK
ncbi:MAG: c-type cytochrome [Deltaproteobacteria bacterium]|nr:c-type cytochrome [Deltaproteobacteria bacterium]